MVAHAPGPATVRSLILEAAYEIGFAGVGFCGAEMLAGLEVLKGWLAAGYAGSMAYLARNPEARVHPASLLSGARTVIAVLVRYGNTQLPEGPLQGVVARFAQGADYHRVLTWKLRSLALMLPRIVGRPVRTRIAVDTSPLLERACAREAGCGFIGHNALLIAPGVGSYTVLGELIVDISVDIPRGCVPEDPYPDSPCALCRACLSACPTGAIVAPRIVDARRCIAYLTAVHRGPIPHSLRPAVGRRIWGCDACQEVCPFNSRVPAWGDPDLALPSHAKWLAAPNLLELLLLPPERYRIVTGGTVFERMPSALLQRNAAVALGNGKDPDAIPVLAEALRHNPSALVRGHVAWALGRIGGRRARVILEQARVVEPDEQVHREIAVALDEACG